MNHSTDAVPHRIARLLRQWARQYPVGMRVLRQPESQHPLGCYLLYPTAPESEAVFFQAPSKGLHLSTLSETDPVQMATPGDPDCVAIFVRSWMIEPQYRADYQVPFLQDCQRTIRRMMVDFPGLCDLHTLLIHPRYEQLATALGFQKTSKDKGLPVYWAYQAIDRFLGFDQAQLQRLVAPLRSD